jgi:hypothetical protein
MHMQGTKERKMFPVAATSMRQAVACALSGLDGRKPGESAGHAVPSDAVAVIFVLFVSCVVKPISGSLPA